MKKKMIVALLSVAAVFAFVPERAQAQSVKKGDVLLSIGMGIGSWHDDVALMPTGDLELVVAGGLGSSRKAGITIGGRLGYYGTVSDDRHNLAAALIAAKTAFHYSFTRDLDTYVGFTLGGFFGNNHSGVTFSVPFGLRYFVDRSVAVLLEAAPGIHNAYILGGISFRL